MIIGPTSRVKSLFIWGFLGRWVRPVAFVDQSGFTFRLRFLRGLRRIYDRGTLHATHDNREQNDDGGQTQNLHTSHHQQQELESHHVSHVGLLRDARGNRGVSGCCRFRSRRGVGSDTPSSRSGFLPRCPPRLSRDRNSPGVNTGSTHNQDELSTR